jgi:hypothetical protein
MEKGERKISLENRLLGCESAMRETRDQIMDGASVALSRRDWRQQEN